MKTKLRVVGVFILGTFIIGSCAALLAHFTGQPSTIDITVQGVADGCVDSQYVTYCTIGDDALRASVSKLRVNDEIRVQGYYSDSVLPYFYMHDAWRLVPEKPGSVVKKAVVIE